MEAFDYFLAGRFVLQAIFVLLALLATQNMLLLLEAGMRHLIARSTAMQPCHAALWIVSRLWIDETASKY